MANADKTLLDKNNQEIYPITRERNVYDDNNINLKNKFNDVVFKSNEVHEFSKNFYEESQNILNLPDIPTTKENGITYSCTDGIINVSGTCENDTVIFDIYDENVPDRGGIRFFHNQNEFPSFVLINTANKSKNDYMIFYEGLYENGATYISPRNYITITIKKGFSGTNIELMPMITNIPVIPQVFGKYNPNRHITNSEAEFLKEEYNKSINLFDEIVTRGNIDNNNGVFYYTSSGNHLVGVNYLPMKPSTVYSYRTSKSGLWIYEYDANKNFLGLVDIVSGSSFTSKSNTSYFRVAFWGGYGLTYLNDAIIKEGTNPIYYPYNSSSHITNAQADLLKSEWEKSSNISPLENKVYSGSFSNTWDSFTIQLLQNFTLKAGKKYSWSAKIKSSNDCRMNKLGLTTNEETLIDLYNLGVLTNNYITVSKTFTPTNDILVDYVYVHNATVGSVDIKEIMVVEGDLHDYQEWNGKILHPKDIAPVTLWENASPNSAYEPDNGVGEIPNDVDLIGIGIKKSNTSSDGEQMFYIKPEQGKTYYLNVSWVSSNVQYTYSRTCYVTSARKVIFYEGHQNTAVNNNSIIPTRILAFRRA